MLHWAAAILCPRSFMDLRIRFFPHCLSVATDTAAQNHPDYESNVSPTSLQYFFYELGRHQAFTFPGMHPLFSPSYTVLFQVYQEQVSSRVD